MKNRHTTRTAVAALMLSLGLLALGGLPLAAQGSPGSPSATLITHIDRDALTKIGGGYGEVLEADWRGIRWAAFGPAGSFRLGVHPNHQAAGRAWQSIEPARVPDGTQVIELTAAQLTGIGERARGWRYGETNNYRLALQRLNVVIEFDWLGPLEAALDFARRFDSALVNDAQLAPRGPQIAPPEVDVIAPAVVAVRQLFPILYAYRSPDWRPRQLFLSDRVEDQVLGQPAAPSAHLSGQLPENARAGRTPGRLDVPGLHDLTLTFISDTGLVFNKPLRLRALDAADTPALAGGEAWLLPEKAIYFVPKSDTRWEAIPEAQREEIRLEHRSLERPNTARAREWQQLAAWNDWAQLLRPEWLPPQNVVQVFKNGARPNYPPVAYASYVKNNRRLILMSEVGMQSWLYLEQPATASTSPTGLTSVLLPGLNQPASEGNGQPVSPRVSFMARRFERQRALKASGPYEPIRILLIHLGEPAQVSFNQLGYE
jgi:hypothetical protein